jgi:predicted enzyme related to lactoylglutathione lyase
MLVTVPGMITSVNWVQLLNNDWEKAVSFGGNVTQVSLALFARPPCPMVVTLLSGGKTMVWTVDIA